MLYVEFDDIYDNINHKYVEFIDILTTLLVSCCEVICGLRGGSINDPGKRAV